MLLEDCAAKGRSCRVLCSQPRRISAVSVSTRVAAERGEKLGKVTGYAIRLEKAASDQTALLFVTTGATFPVALANTGCSQNHCIPTACHLANIQCISPQGGLLPWTFGADAHETVLLPGLR